MFFFVRECIFASVNTNVQVRVRIVFVVGDDNDKDDIFIDPVNNDDEALVMENKNQISYLEKFETINELT